MFGGWSGKRNQQEWFFLQESKKQNKCTTHNRGRKKEIIWSLSFFKQPQYLDEIWINDDLKKPLENGD